MRSARSRCFCRVFRSRCGVLCTPILPSKAEQTDLRVGRERAEEFEAVFFTDRKEDFEVCIGHVARFG